MSSAISENAIGGLILSEVHGGPIPSEIQGVINMLVSRIRAGMKLEWGLKEELEELQREFYRLSEMLGGVSHLRITNEIMAQWLKKIKDVAADADNFLDECSYKVLKDRIRTQRRNMSMNIPIKSFISRQGMAQKARDIRKSIDNIYNDALALGIKPIAVTAGEPYSCIHSETRIPQYRRRCADDKSLFGRDKDIQELVNLLCDPINTNSDLNVIGIVGMAGLGKTTLSKHISKLQQVTEFFNSKVIWLVISHKFDMKDLLDRMVKFVFGIAPTMEGTQAVISKLRDEMKDKRYLIILDDAWDTFEWAKFQYTLSEIGVSKGTSILVTSRDKNVVEQMFHIKAPIIHELQGLSEGDSWSLFMSRMNSEYLANRYKELIARRMIKKSGGVPLAIQELGDLLSDSSIRRWNEIEKCELWAKMEECSILPSLKLSYDYLPHANLKKCFAYCAIFGEDEVIKKDNLIYMWMAQGFLEHHDKMELLGEVYIEHLLNSNLLQEVEEDDRGNVKTFKIHYLVWTLLRDISVEEGLCSRYYVERSEVIPLSISGNFESTELQTCLLDKLLVFSSLEFLLKYKHLRVLNVGKKWGENLDWKPLGSLIHLRYFEITVNNERDLMQSDLPHQITKLYHLQTLCINCCTFMALFPKEIGNLVNLRHILSDDPIGIPTGLSHLTALQTLPVIKLEMKWGGRLSDLGWLTNIRGRLVIESLSLINDQEEARNLNLGSKSNLDSLVLKWGNGNARDDRRNPHANEILEALEPSFNLHTLDVLHFDGTAFPRWLIGPGSLLSNLVSLKIRHCKASGNLYLENFIGLRLLRLENCKRLTIRLSKNGTQCCKFLEELHIVGCYEVEVGNLSTDVLVGLGSLSLLRELYTDLLLPADLGEESPVCKSLKKLALLSSFQCKGHATSSDLPDQLRHLVALQSLSLGGFESVEMIPNWLGNLTNLRNLRLYKMQKLKHLPPRRVMQGLYNLTTFTCGLCPLFKEDVKMKGEEWLKIAHIPEKYV